MSKIYDEWNENKKEIAYGETPKIFINIRDIWFTKMGKNIGYEEDGKDRFLRPVLVIKKVGCVFFTVALTSQGKSNSSYYHKVKEMTINQNNQKNIDSSYIILSQVKVMDKRRFTQFIGTVTESEFLIIKQKLRILLF